MPADGQRGGPAKEVLPVVDLCLDLGQPLEVQRRHLEHLTGTLAVTGGDDRRVNVDESTVLEEAVDGRRQRVADAGNRPKRVRPRPQVGDLPEELETVTLLLQRIVLGIRLADHFQRLDPQFDPLPLARRLLERSDSLQAGTGGDPGQHFIPAIQVTRDDQLQARETTAVVEFNERQAGLGIPAGPHPAAHLLGLTRLPIGKYLHDPSCRHLVDPQSGPTGRRSGGGPAAAREHLGRPGTQCRLLGE